MAEKTIVKETIDDGVKIIEYSDGSTTFKAIDIPKTISEPDNRGFWKKLKDWWNNAPIRPYAGIRDLSDPFGELKKDPSVHDGSGSKSAVEVGIQFRF